MDLDRISVFEKILVNIRDVIQESEEFKDIDVYFDDSEMNPNISLPAISFKVGQKEVLNSSASCTEYYRRERDLVFYEDIIPQVRGLVNE